MVCLGLTSHPCTCAVAAGAVEVGAAVVSFAAVVVEAGQTGPLAQHVGDSLSLEEAMAGAAAVVAVGAAEEANSDLVVASGPSLAGVGAPEGDSGVVGVVALVAAVRFGHV